MTWSGFRPSDDACVYGYLVPSNMFAVVVLEYIAQIAEVVLKDEKLKEEALSFSKVHHLLLRLYLKSVFYIPCHQKLAPAFPRKYAKYHHMLQIELMDTLLDTIARDENFKSFHLDGQTIMLEDYLQVRPEREEELKKAIREGKIQIALNILTQIHYLILHY